MTPDYVEGRAEGLGLALQGVAFGFSHCHNVANTTADAAAWLVTNGGAEFYKRLADAIKAEQAKSIDRLTRPEVTR